MCISFVLLFDKFFHDILFVYQSGEFIDYFKFDFDILPIFLQINRNVEQFTNLELKHAEFLPRFEKSKKECNMLRQKVA